MSKDKLKDGLRVFVVPVDILEFPDLDIYEQTVYIVLRSFCSPQNDTAFPKYSTIAKLGRMSERKAEQCVKSLIEKNLLEKQTRLKVTTNKKITNDSNLYKLISPNEALDRANDVHPVGEQHAPTRANDMRPPGEHRAPEQYYLTKPLEQNQLTTTKEDSAQMEIPLDPIPDLPPIVVVQSPIDQIKFHLDKHGISVSTATVKTWLKHGKGEIRKIIATIDGAVASNPDDLAACVTAALKGNYIPTLQTRSTHSAGNDASVTVYIDRLRKAGL